MWTCVSPHSVSNLYTFVLWASFVLRSTLRSSFKTQLCVTYSHSVAILSSVYLRKTPFFNTVNKNTVWTYKSPQSVSNHYVTWTPFGSKTHTSYCGVKNTHEKKSHDIVYLPSKSTDNSVEYWAGCDDVGHRRPVGPAQIKTPQRRTQNRDSLISIKKDTLIACR